MDITDELRCALKRVALARDMAMVEHGEDWDVDWLADQFNIAYDRIENLITILGHKQEWQQCQSQ